MGADEIAIFRTAAFFLVLAVCLSLETLFPARPWRDSRLKRLSFHFGLSFFNAVCYRLAAAAPLLALTAHAHGQGWGVAGLLGLGGPLEWAATVVVMDLFDYWWHRLNHRVPFLWRFHRAHHYDTHVDATTSLRFHIGELLLSGLAKAAWIVAWGPSPAAFALFETGVTAYAQFHHSNIDLPDGVERALRKVHMTPRLHAAHHTVALRTRDANFSTIFLWWDGFFGTLREADAGELQTLGIREGRDKDLSFWSLLKSPVSL